MSTSTVTQVTEELSSKLNLDGSSIEKPVLPKWEAPKPTKLEVEWADILTVDLSLYETKKQELIDTVQTALERDGFFYVINHGIPQETLRRQFDIGQHTFDGVSREEKEKHVAPIKEKGSFMGYKLQNYWEIKDGVRDRIEHYNFYQNHIDPVTRHPEPLQPFVGEAKTFLRDIRQKVLRRILNLIDGVLGLEEGYLFNLHEDDKGTTGDDLLRYMLYEPLSPEDSLKTNGVMLNGHTDFNSLSTLVSQPITSLQVLMPDNVWRYVKHKDEALVINIGDQLSFMSGGILKGTMHRVVSPPEDQRHYRRLGVFHFAQFRNGISLNLLPSKKVHELGHIIFDNEVPTTDQWEATRVRNYGTAKFIKGEEYDIEEIAGIQLRHYH